jgi:hypothetical protein
VRGALVVEAGMMEGNKARCKGKKGKNKMDMRYFEYDWLAIKSAEPTAVPISIKVLLGTWRVLALN